VESPGLPWFRRPPSTQNKFIPTACDKKHKTCKNKPRNKHTDTTSYDTNKQTTPRTLLLLLLQPTNSLLFLLRQLPTADSLKTIHGITPIINVERVRTLGLLSLINRASQKQFVQNALELITACLFPERTAPADPTSWKRRKTIEEAAAVVVLMLVLLLGSSHRMMVKRIVIGKRRVFFPIGC
jgi:hypothetical protein